MSLPMARCYLGTETPYYYTPESEIEAPSGYHAVYISHLSRHGSRYVTSSKGAQELYKVLSEAYKQNELTQEGKQLRRQIRRFMALSQGKYGLLTPFGVQEQKGIAKRMYAHYPTVFGKQVHAVSTYVTRAKQSMDVFIKELSHYIGRKPITTYVNGEVDPLLRFFDLNEAYIQYKEKGKWKAELATFTKREDVSTPFMAKFIKESYGLTPTKDLDLATTLYSIYANTYNMQVDLGLGQYFDECTLKYYWENENLKNYLEKGPSNMGQDLPTNIAFALLRDFIDKSDAALQRGDVSADLRFAHAETIIPFASLLDLLTWGRQTDQLNTVSKFWKDECIAPMAANIQWIFYKGEENQPILVKMLYNEKAIPFPTGSNERPYYRWEDVKDFYEQVLQGINIPNTPSVVEQVKLYTAN